MPNGRVPALPALSESPPVARVVPDTSPLSAVRRCPGFASQLALELRRRLPVHSACAAPVHLPPGFDEKRWRQQMRQRGEAQRAVCLGLAAICSSPVDIRFLLLSVGDVSPVQHLDLLRRFPLCAASPRRGPADPTHDGIGLPGWSIQAAYSIDRQDRRGSPRFRDASLSARAVL